MEFIGLRHAVKTAIAKCRRITSLRESDDGNRRALAQLGEEQLSNLSELGVQVWRDEHRGRLDARFKDIAEGS